MPDGDKPVIAVLGGTGFIGRNLVHFLVSNELATKVVAVDKRIPEMAWLSDKHKESFKKVHFTHANLFKAQSVIGVFDKHPDIEYVINCAGETKPGQTKKIYEEGIYQLSVLCAQEAARRGVRCYVEVSNAQLLSLEKSKDLVDLDTLSLSDDKLHWMQTSLQKWRVERALKDINNLTHVIARLAVVYGDADFYGLTPHLVFAGVCKYSNEALQMLWDKKHAYSTVHVDDVSRGLWHLCLHGNHHHRLYYLADKGCTTQGAIAEHLSSIFNIEHSFLGNITTNLAKMKMGEVVERVIEQHLPPWMEACHKDGVFNTPLYPVLVEDIFNSKACHIDGSYIEESTGFIYQHPCLTQQHLRSLLQYYLQLKLYPPSLLTHSMSLPSFSPSSSSNP